MKQSIKSKSFTHETHSVQFILNPELFSITSDDFGRPVLEMHMVNFEPVPEHMFNDQMREFAHVHELDMEKLEIMVEEAVGKQMMIRLLAERMEVR